MTTSPASLPSALCPLPSADAEVIVVGGGPAGAAVATHLARGGRRVVLLEGRDLARERLAEMRSGEVLSPGGQAELRRLGLATEGVDWRFESFALLRNCWPDGRETRDRLPRGLAYWQTHRGRLDRALFSLAREAGAECHDHQRVREVLRDRSGAVCGVVTRDGAVPGRAWRAPIVVDASGRYSAIVAQLGLKEPDPEFRRSAIVTFYEDVAGCEPGVWEQHFLARFGSAVKGARMTNGICRFSLEIDLDERDRYAARHGTHSPRDLTLAILRDLAPHLYERFRVATPLPHSTAYAPIAYRVRRITHDGLLMVGDAAGYLDPGTGQGMEFALRTARVAADVIDRALMAGDFRAVRFAPYMAGRQREIARAIGWLRLYLRLTRRARLVSAVSRVPLVRAGMIRAMVRG